MQMFWNTAPRFTPVVDGDLADWKSLSASVFGRDQIFEGADKWRSGKDLSADFLVSWDNNRLYLAGTVRDDQFAGDDLAAQGGVEVGDRLHGLDLAEGLALVDLAADVGEVTVDEVSLVAVGELLHGEVGDADNDEVALMAALR